MISLDRAVYTNRRKDSRDSMKRFDLDCFHRHSQ